MAAAWMMQIRRALSLISRTQPQASYVQEHSRQLLSSRSGQLNRNEYHRRELSRRLLPSTCAHLSINKYNRRGLKTLINPNNVTDEDQEQREDGSFKPSKSSDGSPVTQVQQEVGSLNTSKSDDSPAVKLAAASNLKTSPRHDLAMIFTCKVCETRSVKTASRESYEKGVVVARCCGCNNLHLIADRLGMFGEPGSIEDYLAASGEEVKKGSADTLNLTLEDLAGKKAVKDLSS